nr:hypothetical protein [Actinomycetota bacterium]
MLAVGLAAAALTPALSPTASAQDAVDAPGAALVEICTEVGIPAVPELGPRTCRTFDAGSTLFAQVCGLLPLPPEACANATDGRVVDSSLVDAYERTWVHRALRLQSRYDDGEPLLNSLWAHTHNSFNATAYTPSVANLDPNQRYSLADQLRMGIRAVELDLHWFLHPAGSAANGGKAVVLCHGKSVEVGPTTVHVGCSLDRLFVDGLQELRSFLAAPGNEDEVVLLYLENQLEGDPAAHAEAAAVIERVLGDLVVRPPGGQPCAEMPLDSTTDALTATRGRVLIVGNCGPGAWGTWVHERGPRWSESGSGGSYPAPSGCAATRENEAYDSTWIRLYEDSTWLSAMVGGPSPAIDVDDVRSMVRCGVDMIGFDRLEPFDGRLEALVWSWAPEEPLDDPARGCAARGTDGRFRMAGCGDAKAFACRTADGAWTVPA